MRQKMDKAKKILISLIVLQAILLAFFKFVLDKGILAATVILVFEACVLYYLFYQFQILMDQQSTGVRQILGTSAKDAYLFSGTGMIIYDDDYVITWMSELFESRGINRVGSKVLNWLPEADDLISGDAETTTVPLDDRIYEICRKEDAPILIFKDITELRHTQESYEEEQTVIGMANLDNYEESTAYEDETEVSAISAAVRTPLMEYCKEHGILTKRMGNARYLMVLNEKIFNDLVADHFSVLSKVRKAAQKLEVSITLSMAFARGTQNFEEMDATVSECMDLAQSRGGDQVAIQKIGEDVKYFGGSSEATEKRSRVRVRVIAHTLKELLNRSSNVIIACHKEADFDCMGAAIGVCRIAQSLHKKVTIVAKTGGIEEKLAAVLQANKEELSKELAFVTESEALNQLKKDTLVIMVDHHSTKQSNSPQVLEAASRVVILDHHRRSAAMGVTPVLVYIEAGASSTCELVSELFPYISSNMEISEIDATIMLTGMMVDTNRFKVRTGSRTYDAASSLRKLGADPMKADAFLKDSFEDFAQKASVTSLGQWYKHNIIIAPVTDQKISRSLMSQTADRLLEIQDVEAAFVIANDTEGETAISARSSGKINVQVIMEKMNGGGHMTAAALQRPACSIEDLTNELKQTIDAYFQEEAQSDASNPEK